ncbi:N-acetylmuramoyl-L-alanine amidase-like domain-containing protein [Sodalis sp. RH20]|uniref:N-acetylmuramoyl-L-alanine amidase-like domain-containing protein n=1 Tax=unclassified Sodalis (in: enterobacteria) TaxID=2636512 RepID=UPI0039B5DA86
MMNIDNANDYARLSRDERTDAREDQSSVSAGPDDAFATMATDAVTSEKINRLIDRIALPCRDLSLGQRLERLSEQFLATPYQANTLVGSFTEKERLVADFRGVDCFTLLDYVCALATSRSEHDFFQRLAAIRYQAGDMHFLARNHFFSDWCAREPANAVDITATLSPQAIGVTKYLNRKGVDEVYIPGLAIVERRISYIPTEKIDAAVLAGLYSGDLIGIYAPSPGLDVSHVGFLIKNADVVYLRNASSLSHNMKVVDSPLAAYLQNKPGIVVLRLH